MKFYSCKVRLGGGMNNEVRKSGEIVIGRTDDDKGIVVNGIPAAEVIILRHLHGADAVVDVVATDDKKVKESYTREYLRMTYAKMVEHGDREVPLVDFLFPPGQPLPIYVADAEEEDGADEEDIAPPPTKKQKGTAAGAAV